MSIVDADVKKIIDTNRDTTTFIATAQLVVDEELLGKGLTTLRLDQIVLYLAAHFTAITEENGGLHRKRMGESDETYKVPGDKDTGLEFTRFGQQALILDTTGTLAALSANKGLKALFRVI